MIILYCEVKTEYYSDCFSSSDMDTIFSFGHLRSSDEDTEYSGGLLRSSDEDTIFLSDQFKRYIWRGRTPNAA